MNKSFNFRNSHVIFTHHFSSSRPEAFYKKGVPRNFAKFAGKHLCQSLCLNKVAGLRPVALFKQRLWHRYFFIDNLWGLLLPSRVRHEHPVKFRQKCQKHDKTHNLILQIPPSSNS